jgi:hypothetical protein
MRAALLDWKQVKGEWKQVESKVEECAVKSANDDVKCTFRPKTGGVYRVTARIYDDRERANESELTLWVAGGKQPPQREVTQEKAELIPDRKEYRAGDVAEIVVQSPCVPAFGTRPNRALQHERILTHAEDSARRSIHAEHTRAGRSRRRCGARR